jgi:hypothetical protein
MSVENNTSPKIDRTSSDEIDLRELFRSIGDFFSNIGLSVLRSLVTFRRITLKFSFLIIAFVIIGGILGGLTRVVIAPYFESSMVIRSSYYNPELMDNMILKLDELSKEENQSILAKTLGIDTSIATGIVGFNFVPFVSEEDKIGLEVFKERLRNEIDDESKVESIINQLETQNRSTFKIFVKALTNDVFPIIEEKLPNYLRNSNFIKRRLEIREQNLKAKKQKLLTEQSKLDSLKIVIFDNLQELGKQKRDGSNNVILSEAQVVNPLSVFTQDMNFYDEVQAIDQELYLQPHFEVIDGFVQFNTPASTGTQGRVAIGMAIGLGVAYVVILLIGINRYLVEFEKKNMA